MMKFGWILDEIFTKAGIKITQLRQTLENRVLRRALRNFGENIETEKRDKSSAVSKSINSTKTALEMMINEFEN